MVHWHEAIIEVMSMREVSLEQRGTCRIWWRESCLILRLPTFMVVVILSEQEPSNTGNKSANIGGDLANSVANSVANVKDNAAKGFYVCFEGVLE